MGSTNSHSSRKAILYARVSTDEQARSGYSLAQQLEVYRSSWRRIGTASRVSPPTTTSYGGSSKNTVRKPALSTNAETIRRREN